MISRGKELFIALIIYVVTMTVLLMAVYRFLENWHLSEFNFFIAGALVFLVAVGWGYILTTLIFAPKKKMEDTLTELSKNIIHELNIPLATIHANSTMLKKSLKDEKSLKRLQRIEDASSRLARLYDELVYTIKKEIHPIEKERFDVSKVVEERVAIFQEQQRHTFTLVLKAYTIEVDKIGFEQMLDNILSNAMKYSPKASLIKIVLDKHSVCVEDEGIGMTTSELLRIHERYFQSDENNEGEGIGLALVKTYCESENIAIHIKSEKNIGTSVCLDLEAVHS
ncbi:MAG: Two-component sensor histidine kinase [uncultured Sulfurovum sp.]|uniref:histidine kinase n=1 Tax=uncultured Sulfurovum sp. TaxID=269237 RepID=A0A6S6TDZ7_9BACT|nr:MAG: Two-component sensor histidine kinase [uncultured Sulfurovum sp.]